MRHNIILALLVCRHLSMCFRREKQKVREKEKRTQRERQIEEKKKSNKKQERYKESIFNYSSSTAAEMWLLFKQKKRQTAFIRNALTHSLTQLTA